MLLQRVKRLRLRAKTPPTPQQPLVGPQPDFPQEEVTGAPRRVISHVCTPRSDTRCERRPAGGTRVLDQGAKARLPSRLLRTPGHAGGNLLGALAHETTVKVRFFAHVPQLPTFSKELALHVYMHASDTVGS